MVLAFHMTVDSCNVKPCSKGTTTFSSSLRLRREAAVTESGEDLKSEDLSSLTFLTFSYLICKMGITLSIITILRIRLEYDVNEVYKCSYW